MKRFAAIRSSGDVMLRVDVVELGWLDMVKLLFGRELAFQAPSAAVRMRARASYLAFNFDAPRASTESKAGL